MTPDQAARYVERIDRFFEQFYPEPGNRPLLIGTPESAQAILRDLRDDLKQVTS